MVQDGIDLILATERCVGEVARFSEFGAVAGVEVATAIGELTPVPHCVTDFVTCTTTGFPFFREEVEKGWHRVEPATTGDDFDVRSVLLRVFEQANQGSGELDSFFAERRVRSVSISNMDADLVVVPIVECPGFVRSLFKRGLPGLTRGDAFVQYRPEDGEALFFELRCIGIVDVLVENTLDLLENRYPFRYDDPVRRMLAVLEQRRIPEDVDALVEGVLKITLPFQYTFSSIPDRELRELATIVGVYVLLSHFDFRRILRAGYSFSTRSGSISTPSPGPLGTDMVPFVTSGGFLKIENL